MTSQGSGNIKATIAANIVAARKAAGLTQRELGERLGVESSLVSKWERSEHRPTDANLAAIAQALTVSMPWLYTDHELEAA